MIKMEEYVIKLAELQAEVAGYEHKADDVSLQIDAEITMLEKELSDLIEERKTIRRPFTEMAEEAQTTIADLHETIIDEWSGKYKTIKFDAGTLKFRTTSKLEIYHPEILIADMFTHLQTGTEMMKYLSGFNKTAVKKYIGVHPQDTDIVELTSTTTVKLEQESG